MTALLELEDVARVFPVRDALGRAKGAVRAVDGVSLSVQEGQVLAIVGESGRGKSTLGRVMLRLIEPGLGATRRWTGWPTASRCSASPRRISGSAS
jgi:ABC-type oligopeptide transport system ATPase subunit